MGLLNRLAFAALLVAGCFSPETRDGVVSCASDQSCPPDFLCNPSDHLCYRTLPGSKHPNSAYFTRGTGHTEAATYSEKPGDWAGNLDRLTRKFDTARKLLPGPIIKVAKGAKVGVIAFGSSDPAVEEARVLLAAEEGISTDYCRLRALPIGSEVREFIESHAVVYVVEQNRDAQCASILRLECPERATLIRSVLHYNGLPIDARSIVEGITLGEKRSRPS